jgi:hypothetical protein
MNVSQIVKNPGKITIYFNTYLPTGSSHSWGGKEFDINDKESRENYINVNAEREKRILEFYEH